MVSIFWENKTLKTILNKVYENYTILKLMLKENKEALSFLHYKTNGLSL